MLLEQSSHGIYQVTLKPRFNFYLDQSRGSVFSRDIPSHVPWTTILGYLAPQEDRRYLTTGEVGDNTLSLELSTRDRIMMGDRQRLLTHIIWQRIDSLERVSDFSSWDELNDLTAQRKDPQNNQQPTSPSELVRVVVASPEGLLYKGNDLPSAQATAEEYVLTDDDRKQLAILTRIERLPDGARLERVGFQPHFDDNETKYARHSQDFNIVIPELDLDELVDFVQIKA